MSANQCADPLLLFAPLQITVSNLGRLFTGNEGLVFYMGVSQGLVADQLQRH